MKTLFYLVRHGQTILNSEGRVQGRIDSPLTQKGIDMARSLRPALSKIGFTACISSPSQRATDTAYYMTGKQPDACFDGLQEFDFGTREGMFIKEAFKEDPAHALGYQRWHGETKAEAVQRFLSCLEDIARQYGTGPILISSHGTIIREVLFSLDETFKKHPNHRSLVPNCSVCQLAYDTVFKIKEYPSTAYMNAVE